MTSSSHGISVEQATKAVLCVHEKRNVKASNEFVSCVDCGLEWKMGDNFRQKALDDLIAAVRSQEEAKEQRAFEALKRYGKHDDACDSHQCVNCRGTYRRQSEPWHGPNVTNGPDYEYHKFVAMPCSCGLEAYFSSSSSEGTK